jgi:rhamnulokinase
MAERTVLAVDLGAESGRVMAVHFDGRALHMEELHRFPNTAVSVHGTLHWDILRLWDDIVTGIRRGRDQRPAGLGVDTWGVDFGLLDSKGHLIGNPVHYRDRRTEGMMDRAFHKVPREEIFARTGIQFLPINTLYQLLSLVEGHSPQLAIAATFLTIPDLLNYWLTGVKVCEFSNATTTQMYNPLTTRWAGDLLAGLGIPDHILPEIVPPGTQLGEFEGIPVITPACHDTGSAVAAVPTTTADYAYISSGTWSLVGLEIEQPILSRAALAANVTNEGGVNGTFRLLKNVMGLWILRQCRGQWSREGETLAYDDLARMAATTPPVDCYIDPNDPRFLPPGDHPGLIRDYCRQTGQTPPETKAAVVRCLLQSLALAYRETIEDLIAVSGRQVAAIHIVGGGGQNALLNQMTADATGRPVMAGPFEATVLGNALVQLMALGDIRTLAEGRQVVAASLGDHSAYYEPQHTASWQEAYEKFRAIRQANLS